MLWLQVVFMAIAVSFDSFAIGIAYGMAKVTIPLLARLVISIISSVVFGLAMLTGLILQQWLPASVTNTLGGVLLILLGAYTIWRANSPTELNQIMRLRIPGLGLIIQVFREPLSADQNRDKNISTQESIVLGITLAFDSIAAGIGAAVLNLPILSTCIAVAIASFGFVSVGLRQGKRIPLKQLASRKLHIIPGLLIIMIGLFRLIA